MPVQGESKTTFIWEDKTKLNKRREERGRERTCEQGEKKYKKEKDLSGVHIERENIENSWIFILVNLLY